MTYADNLSPRREDWRCVDCGGAEQVAGWPRRCIRCLTRAGARGETSPYAPATLPPAQLELLEAQR